MRVTMTDSLRKSILDSVLKPLFAKRAALVDKIAESRDDFIAEVLGPELAAAREKMKAARLLSTSHYFAFHVVIDGRGLIINLGGRGYAEGVPKALQVYLSPGESFEERQAKCVTLSGPGVDKHVDDFREILKLRGRRATLRTEIGALLEKATTLQDVYKVWPSVLEHVDETVRERFHRKPKPRTAAKAAAPQGLELSSDAAIELSKLRLGAI